MKKWYQSSLCKGLLLLAAHVSAAALAVCIGIGLLYPGQNYGEIFFNKGIGQYKDTRGFANELEERAWNILSISQWKDILFTEGKYDSQKVIDIDKFRNGHTIAEEPGELSFHLQDLLDACDNRDLSVLVCQPPEAKENYQYFTVEQFVEEVHAKGYTFPQETDSGFSTEDVLQELQEEEFAPQGEVVDSKGELVYSQVWFMSNAIWENLKTISGKNLIEFANESETWNGKLNELVTYISDSMDELTDYYYSYQEVESTYANGETNVSFLFVDYGTGEVESNLPDYETAQAKEINVNAFEEIARKGKYVDIAPTLAECKTNLSSEYISLANWKHMVANRPNHSDNYRFTISVDVNYPIQDAFYERNQSYEKYMPWVDQVLFIGALSIVLFVVCLIWLTAVAGRSNHQEGVALLFFDKWKTEIWLCLMIAISLAIALPLNLVDGYIYDWNAILQSGQIAGDAVFVFGAAAAMTCACFLTVYLSLVRVLKAKTLWKNSLTKWLCKMVRYIWQNRSSITRLIVAGVGLFLVNFMILTGSGFFVLLAMAVDVVAVLYFAKLAIEKTRIKKGIMKIAAGDTEYKIPVDNLTGENKEMAEMVNHIGEGIQNAVEKSLKDERLKTDLITNVSHDIKTPLTSIINYVGLLKQEHFDDPKIQRYLDILDQKSQRLKTLTEDVVEASKISSGNINLEFINLNLVEMIHQTTGEFAEKFEKRNLTAVVTVPEEPVIVRVDGRRMWRVIENIYNNAAKYAMPGTRVYVDLSMNKNLVLLSLKNVSEYPLNITADELMERFTRGDVSRTTEGSGLGLSIAQNLTKMQGGEFKLYVDGDLFKVMISFPRIRPKVEKSEWAKKAEQKTSARTENLKNADEKGLQKVENENLNMYQEVQDTEN